MPSNCLPATGGSVAFWLFAGLVVFTIGLLTLRSSRALVINVIIIGCFIASVGFDANQQSANALCSPMPSSLIQGQLRVVSGTVSSAELPVATATSGQTVITALWGEPEQSGSDVVIAFAFPGVTAGDWMFDITESSQTAFEFLSSDLSLVVNSSRMLTGGPFNASSASPISVAASGLSFEIAVTRS